MATLQTLRNKGPLLIIFVGLALLAFIAGDAVKLFDSNSRETSVGTVGKEEVSIDEYQSTAQAYEIYNKVLNRIYGTNEKSADEIRNYVWSLLTQEKQFLAYAEELGLAVTPEEINYVLSNRPELHMELFRDPCPFVNQANYVFDVNALSSFLEQYEQMKNEGELTEDVADLYTYWKFLERELKLKLAIYKVTNVYAASSIVNPAVAQKNFNLGNDTIKAEVARFALDKSIIDSVKVSDEEIAEFYNKNIRFRENWHNIEETRDIKYTYFMVTPSDEDRENTRLAMQQCADTLKSGYDNYSRLARFTQSENISKSILLTADELHSEIRPESNQQFGTYYRMLHLSPALTSRIKDAEINEVIEPQEVNGYYYVLKNLDKQYIPKEMTLNYAIISHKSKETLASTVDTLLTKLNNGGDFAELTAGYDEKFDSVKFETNKLFNYYISATNEQIRNAQMGQPISEETRATSNLSSIMMNDSTQLAIYNATTEAYNVIDLPQGNSDKAYKVVFKVLEKNDSVMAYKPLIMRRKVVFSDNTYNNELTEFNKFVASCKNISDFEANAKKSGKYIVLNKPALEKMELNIGGADRTADLIKWAFNEKTEVGTLSEVCKCGEDNNMFMVAALEKVNHKGYMSLDQAYKGHSLYDEIKNEIKMEKAYAKLIEKVSKMSDSEIAANLEKVEPFEYNTNVTVGNTTDPIISAVAAKLNAGEKSAPFKGNNGVYVVKVLEKASKGGKLDMKAENLKAKTLLDPSSILKTLYFKNPAESNFHKF